MKEDIAYTKEDYMDLSKQFNFASLVNDIADGYKYAVALDEAGMIEHRTWVTKNDPEQKQTRFVSVQHVKDKVSPAAPYKTEMDLILFKDEEMAQKFNREAGGIAGINVVKLNAFTLKRGRPRNINYN